METGIRRKREVTTANEIIKCIFTDDAECPSRDCQSCENLSRCKEEIINRWSKIPDYVLNKLLKLHPSAVKTFLLINRKANFTLGHKDYGSCQLSCYKIEKATSLTRKTIRENIKMLQDSKLLYSEIDRHKTNEEWKTGHTFYIHWMLLDKELKEREPL